MRRCLLLLGVLAGLSLPAVLAAPSTAGWKSYDGAWFSIKYPPGFRVRPSLRSSSARGFDSAFFTSPDGSVEFYVFSPQWNGEPKDIEADPKKEKVVSNKTERKTAKSQTTRVRWVTIRAKNGSYTRSFVDTENETLNTRLVFGIKYRNDAVYKRYRSAYVAFKGSLTQYAD